MEKIYRKDKIELLASIYFGVVESGDSETTIAFNKIIIDSIGVSGLEEVKKIAWKSLPKKERK